MFEEEMDAFEEDAGAGGAGAGGRSRASPRQQFRMQSVSGRPSLCVFGCAQF